MKTQHGIADPTEDRGIPDPRAMNVKDLLPLLLDLSDDDLEEVFELELAGKRRPAGVATPRRPPDRI